MVKALFTLAKYLTWWFIKPLKSWLCCKSHTPAANIKFQPSTCSGCFKQYFPFLLEDIPGYMYTLIHTLVHDKYSPASWVSRKLRPKSRTIPCYTVDCFKLSRLLFVDTGSATWLPICVAKPSRNRHHANWTAWLEWAFKSSSVMDLVYSYKANQTRFEHSVLFSWSYQCGLFFSLSL